MKVSSNNSVVLNSTLFILFVILVSSCAPAKYLPTQQTIPLVQKNELKAITAVSAANPITSALMKGEQYAVNTSLTYGVTEDLTVHTSAMTTLDSEDNRKSITAGIGYQFPLSPSLNLQTYLLGARGKVTSEGEEFWWGNYDVDADVSSISFQSQITSQISPKTNFTFSTALKKNFFQIDELYEINSSSNMRIEPALSLSYSPSRFGFMLELGTSIIASDTRLDNVTSDQATMTALFNLYGSLGITYCITCKTS